MGSTRRSSLYDFLPFDEMLWIFEAGPEYLRAGWFIESLVTVTQVILVIGTAANPLMSRPTRLLPVSVVGAVFAGL